MIFSSICTGKADVFIDHLIAKYDVSTVKNLTFKQVYLFVLDNISTNKFGDLALNDLALHDQTQDLIEALEFLLKANCKS